MCMPLLGTYSYLLLSLKGGGNSSKEHGLIFLKSISEDEVFLFRSLPLLCATISLLTVTVITLLFIF